MSIRTGLTGALLALSLSACAGGAGGPAPGDPFSAASDGPRTVSIHVRNLNFSQATLWAVSRGGRQRLGVVGGKEDAVYRIPWTFPQPMEIEINLLAGPRCTTEALEVDPGDVLELQIEMDLSRQQGCR